MQNAQYSQRELAAIVRLSVYAQCFKDDMEDIVAAKDIYKGQIKVHAKSLLHLVTTASKNHLSILLEKPEHADTVANAWNALDYILKAIASMPMDEMIQFSQQLKEYDKGKQEAIAQGAEN